jgi:hypothetical protein
MWQLIDQSDGKMKGYLRILRDGKRVADMFPYAPGIDSHWTIEMAHYIVDTMNERDMIKTSK